MTAPCDAAGVREPTVRSEALEMLALRYSVGPKFLAPPAPTAAQWQRAAALALRAPDHGGLRPFRFVIVDDAQRSALSELFVRDAIRRGHVAVEVDRARSRRSTAPGSLRWSGACARTLWTCRPTSNGCASVPH